MQKSMVHREKIVLRKSFSKNKKTFPASLTAKTPIYDLNSISQASPIADVETGRHELIQRISARTGGHCGGAPFPREQWCISSSIQIPALMASVLKAAGSWTAGETRGAL